MNPKISVCIPVYNVENYIGKCLESVLSQSFQDFEIVVVNDSTPDKSMDIVSRYAQGDSRIRIFNNPHNMGLMWTRRESYVNAIGDYICFLDSDDTLPKDSLNSLYNAIEQTKSDMVCGQIAYISAQQTSLTSYPNMLSYGDDKTSAMKSALRWEITHNLCGKIYRRELLQSYNYITYEQVINAEDAILFYQLLNNIKKVSLVKDVVYNYYQYGDSSTNAKLTEKALNGIFLWQRHRWEIVQSNYPGLIDDLKQSMTKYLCSLAPSMGSRSMINTYLDRYSVPFKLDIKTIFKYTSHLDRIKCCVLLYFYYAVRVIRNARIRLRSVK